MRSPFIAVCVGVIINSRFAPASSDCNLLWYYQQTYNTVKSHGGQALLNPGVTPAECYVGVSDILLSAENDWWTYSNQYCTRLIRE